MKTNIQALRFVAAVMVVMFHVVKSLPGDNAGSPIYDWFRYWGLAGVDVFFVISGFVMVWSQAHNPKPLGQFLRDRVIRIVPMYWLLTAVMALILYAVPQLFHSLSFDGDLTVASFTFTSWTVEKRLPLLYVGWTLEYELAFYLVFALAFTVLPLSLTPVPVAILFTAGAVFGPTTIIALEFVMGMIVGLATLKGWRPPFPLAIGILGAVLLAMGDPAHGAIPRVLAWGVPSTLVVLALVNLPQIRPGLSTYLGAASYSVYLVQVLAIPAAQRLVLALMPQAGFTAKSLTLGYAAVGIGCLLYSFVEKPLTRLLRGRARVAA